jgi:hypothetical protein
LEDAVIFSSNISQLPVRRDPLTDALEVWRTAAGLVSERWSIFTSAGLPSERAAAFAAYVAALDAEEFAADQLRRLALPQAA